MSTKEEKLLNKDKYDKIVNSLNDEREKLEHELRKEYRNARHYVRKHPEQGVGISFLGGLIIGFVVAKLLD
jgi:ElaB/YqjD/DUF883 family membrane-anchored ribosome-binding protein